MRQHNRYRIPCIALTLAVIVQMGPLRAQRLSGNINGRTKMVIRNSRNPMVDTLTSEGAVDDAVRIQGMTFRFRPSPAQSAELERLLEQQQDPTSPLFHQWLTPEEYGRRFGLSEGDLTKVSDWLASEGFHVDYLSKSRAYLSFSGTAGQVRNALATELHRFTWHGKQHFANIREIMVPAELEPLMYPPMGLDDLQDQPMAQVRPRLSWNDGSHSLTPGDLAVIYNLAPLYDNGTMGVGQKIVIVGRSALTLDDVRAFRKAGGLPAIDPKSILVEGSARIRE